MFRSKFLLAAVVAAAAIALAAPATSQAGFSVKAVVGANKATINDNNTPANTTAGSTANVTDRSAAAGTISTNTVNAGLNHNGDDIAPFTVGGVRIGFSAQINENSAQSLLSSSTDLVLKNNSGAAVTVVLTISYDGFTLPGNAPEDLKLNNELTITAFNNSVGTKSTTSSTGSVKAKTSANDDPVTSGEVGGNVAGLYTSDAIFHRTSTPYTMTQTITVKLGVGESVKFDQESTLTPVVPAPAGLVLLATALPFAGLLRRRLRKSEVATAA